MSIVKIHNLGFPRIGRKRELKKSLESYWKKQSSAKELEDCAAALRADSRQVQSQLDFIPVNDFSYYDQILDMSCLLGAVPQRFHKTKNKLEAYFDIARGNDCSCASEMTKWFDTNYHYIVPELSEKTNFSLSTKKIFNEFLEHHGNNKRPVLIGPVTYLSLARETGSLQDRFSLLDSLLPVYKEILDRLQELGAEWVQIDEPIFSSDLSERQKEALTQSYRYLPTKGIKILLTNYFGALRENLPLFFSLEAAGYHIDALKEPDELSLVASHLPEESILSLGVIDGRNIWRSDYSQVIKIIKPLLAKLGKRLWLAPNCSLMHVPYSLEHEHKLPKEVKKWLAFAEEKLQELVDLRAILEGNEKPLIDNHKIHKERSLAASTFVREIRERCYKLEENDYKRSAAFSIRNIEQAEELKLPPLPTTTIGSFPQTAEIRQKRALYKKGLLSTENYDEFLKKEIIKCIDIQNEIGLDVLVHGEAERNDMVEYFGEQLEGFCFSQFGWVQSYGSRCVKPPIIYGDVSRPKPMTVKWSQFARENSNKPMKGMLTGPVTILQWSFVRNDLEITDIARQVALAIRDEVCDLEAAGLEVIQVDEPALREGLPLQESDKAIYLQWSVDAFRLSTAGVKNSTQIHTHMCYADFNEIIEQIAAMDADVISLEASRSDQALLEVFKFFNYPNDIGPGVYDIHSPRIPASIEFQGNLEAALKYIPLERLWVNPDCGLKTRNWDEVSKALNNMVQATKKLRLQLA